MTSYGEEAWEDDDSSDQDDLVNLPPEYETDPY